MDIIEIIQRIEQDWVLMSFVFALGAAWWQGKHWFNKVNQSLEKITESQIETSKKLDGLKEDHKDLNERVNTIEETVVQIHDVVHGQEVKLAILETKSNMSVLK